jgi:hypothetical protein
MGKHEISTSLFGCMAYSPLFDTESLTSRFRIAWNRGSNYLLVLDDPSKGTPITAEFLSKWKIKAVSEQIGLGEMGNICHRLAGYYKAQGEQWPVKADTSLPRLKGWQ